jgi:NADH dehydrogenase
MWNYVTYQRGARLIVDGADEQQAARSEKATPAATAVEVTRIAERVPSSGSDWR